MYRKTRQAYERKDVIETVCSYNSIFTNYYLSPSKQVLRKKHCIFNLGNTDGKCQNLFVTIIVLVCVTEVVSPFNHCFS